MNKFTLVFKKSMSKRDIPEDIKLTVLELVADFRDNIFTKAAEQGDLLLVEFFFKKMTNIAIAEKIVLHILSRRKQIEKRDVQFFLEKKKEIFQGLPSDRVEYFANLVQTPEKDGGMSDENRDAVWAYFDTLAELAEEYKKNKMKVALVILVYDKPKTNTMF